MAGKEKPGAKKEVAIVKKPKALAPVDPFKSFLGPDLDDPFGLISALFGGPLFSRDFPSLVFPEINLPDVDVAVADDKITVTADIPGLDPEKDVQIEVKDGNLVLSGGTSQEEKTEEKGYTRVERRSGAFQRSFRLPPGADAENIKASAKNGVLTITVPLGEAVPPKQIKVDIKVEG